MKPYVRFVTAAIATAVTSTAIFAASSAYLGQESRGIKALSDEETGAYLTGKGMGMAKAAELNGYPGPAHVLELATELDLSEEQRARTESLFTSMSKEASVLGTELIEKERTLDQLFASKKIDPISLAEMLEKIGALQARIREAHLAAHLTQVDILTPAQNARYAELRGYQTNAQGAGRGHHQH